MGYKNNIKKMVRIRKKLGLGKPQVGVRKKLGLGLGRS